MDSLASALAAIDTGLSADELDDPVGEPGEWIPRLEFNGRKSFGAFECKCRKIWVSAHAYKDYEQGCKGCEQKSLPKFMWVNVVRVRAPRDVREVDPNKPHDTARCGACRAGVCDALR